MRSWMPSRTKSSTSTASRRSSPCCSVAWPNACFTGRYLFLDPKMLKDDDAVLSSAYNSWLHADQMLQPQLGLKTSDCGLSGVQKNDLFRLTAVAGRTELILRHSPPPDQSTAWAVAKACCRTRLAFLQQSPWLHETTLHTLTTPFPHD